MIRILFFSFAFLACELHASIFENPYNLRSEDTIERFHLLGERCSGTNFLTVLMKENFPLITRSFEYGHKHFIPWLDVTNPSTVMQYTDLESQDFFKNSENCLFIFIVRNPYDWVRSLFIHRHHIPQELLSNFTTFLCSPWFTKDPSVKNLRYCENQNPETKEPFQNVLELRRYKILNFLKVRNYVNNYLFVRYEDLKNSPEEFIAFLIENYNLPKQEEIVAPTEYIYPCATSNGTPFKEKKYFDFTLSELDFFENHIDWQVEQLMGYQTRNFLINPPSLPSFARKRSFPLKAN